MQTNAFQTNDRVGNACEIAASDNKFRSDEIAIHFGENLVRCRRRLRMSQEELGARAQLHRTEIGLLEHGHRGGRIDTLLKLAGALSVSPAELLDGIEWVPGDAGKGQFTFTSPGRRSSTSA